jgi:hypothetical protein
MSSGLAQVIPAVKALAPNWWTWDKETVYQGIFANDNIMIHVGQNLFNFMITTLAWFFISQIFTLGDTANDGATGRSFVTAAEEVINAIEAFEKKHR